MPIERKLAAIMFTDIVGYTESMSKSESQTLNLLEKKRSILKPLFKEYKGTFVKEIGDGTLSYFESAVNAATCAVKLQENTYDDKEMNIRVGIHIGDIVFKDGDVFGGGVNVASRLESIAPAGGVCVSKSVYDELSNQDDFDGIDLGLQSLKGVGRLIEVFGLKGDKLNEPDPQKYQDNKVAVHSDDEVPSVAIIPFENKGKEEDVFYAYGICADLISDVSSAGLIRVPSLKRVEEVADLSLDEKATKLDVRYTVEGTLWKMGDIFQLSVELYDTKNKKVVWSDRWQEKWDNLPSIKGNLSDGLLKALNNEPMVDKKTETTNPEAYEYYLKAKYKFQKRKNNEDMEIARGLAQKAFELDSELLNAQGLLGWTYFESGDYDKAIEIFTRNLEQAKVNDDKQVMGSSLNGIGTFYLIQGEYDNALNYYKRSLDTGYEADDKKRIANLIHNIGTIYELKGDYNKSLEHLTRAHDMFKEIGDNRGIGLSSIGHVFWLMGDYDETLNYLNHSLEKEQYYPTRRIIWGYICFGKYYISQGNNEIAIEYLDKAYTLANKIELKETLLDVTTYLFLAYKIVGIKYNQTEIYTLIKEKEHIEFAINYPLYLLLEDASYLETAFNQIQELAGNLEPDVAAKFLSYPMPKAIVEEWEKVK